MSTFTLELPAEYSYVLAITPLSLAVNWLHFVLTARARGAAKLPYPIAYASQEQAAKDQKAFAFNCAQRAHANYTEQLTPFLGTFLVAGLKYPMAAAVMGGAWTFGRVIYALGYAGTGPKGRIAGSMIGAVASFGLLITSVMTGFKLVGDAGLI